MKDDIEVAKEIIVAYLNTLDEDIVKKELDKIEKDDVTTLYTHVKVLSNTFNDAKEMLKEIIIKNEKEVNENENIK